MPEQLLRKYFGYHSFRPLQEEIIRTVCAGRDSLVIMPTGGGKSLCYQIPALKLPGTALVVSPLISLMKNQVDALHASGVRAAYWNSTLTPEEQKQVYKAFTDGALDLLYLSPEKITSSSLRQHLKQKPPSINLIAIDEAHCISSWGHDFRPEYNMLQFLKQFMPDTPMIALTATADRITRQDILEQLQLKAPEIFIASFDRPNIDLDIRAGHKRREQIIHFIQERPGTSGIIYCLSRKQTERLAGQLQKAGIAARSYHAGMSANARSEVQEQFIKDEMPIIVATIAFGMGIDKSNVRWVIHYNLPKNIESYYQEIGRAGRDGLPAEALLFYSYSDVMLWREIIQNENSPLSDVKLHKLQRMQQYAEAITCRRRILLSYFNEDMPSDCGHCDICRHPPERIDGTEITQKALSAIYRLREQAGMTALIDILRGSAKREIVQREWHHIPTYGTGREYSFQEWQNYLLQLLHLGYLEVALDRNKVVVLTPASRRVLFEGERVPLVQRQTQIHRKEHQIAQAKSTKNSPSTQRVRDGLFEALRKQRRQIALEKGLPPYIIFSDATLEEMAAMRPKDEQQLHRISGVGEHKLRSYGKAFLQTIRHYEASAGPVIHTDTRRATLQRFEEGLSPEEIAEERQLTLPTIYGHLAQCIESGALSSCERLLTPEELEAVREARLQLPGSGNQLRPIYEFLNGSLPYPLIRIAQSFLQHEEPRQ